MNHKLKENKLNKSLKERFIQFIGVLFFLIYLALGLIIIFWKSLPLNLEYKNRVLLGIVLIIYAIIRFYRFVKENKE